MPNYIDQARLLKRRNWNPRRIKVYLGEPDKYAPNPKSPNYRDMKLYDLNRVYRAEVSGQFRLEVFRSKQRRYRCDAEEVEW